MHLIDLDERMKELEESLEREVSYRIPHYSKNVGIKYENLKSSLAKKVNEVLMDLSVQGVMLQEIETVVIPEIKNRILKSKSKKGECYAAISSHFNEVLPLLKMISEYHVSVSKADTGECITLQLEKAVMKQETLKEMAAVYYSEFKSAQIPQQTKDSNFERLVNQLSDSIEKRLNASVIKEKNKSWQSNMCDVDGERGDYFGYW